MELNVTGKLFVCDNCGNKLFQAEGQDPSAGVYGNISVIAGGGYGYEFYSCQVNENHVIGAMRRAEQYVNANPDEQEEMRRAALS